MALHKCYICVAMVSWVVKATVIALVMEGSYEISCLEGRDRCYGNATCKSLLDTMPSVCDETIYTCTTPHRFQCRALLSSLQTSKYFRSCTCGQSDTAAAECIELQNLIFLHACVTHEENSSRVPWQHSGDTQPGPHDPLTGAVDTQELERIEQELDKALSCIGVRKMCLDNLTCRETWTEFRDYCKENKKKRECVSNERERCFAAIQDLIRQSTLFECKCPPDIRSPITMSKCKRIQSRIANNTCLVTVPYFIYSSRTYETSYTTLESLVHPGSDNDNFDIESTCTQAFHGCNADASCRRGMAEFMNECNWSTSANRCNRDSCLAALKHFYLLVRPEYTHALLFCRCQHGDRRCQAVRRSMYPTCSVLESPPPSCLTILERCYADQDCRVRWQAYEKLCAYDKKVGGCLEGPALCRNAQVGIMGTVLTTNCTCSIDDQQEQKKCLESRDRLQHRNLCKDLSVKDYHSRLLTTTPAFSWPPADRAAPDVHPEVLFTDCQRLLRQKIPKFMEQPTIIREYDNNSDCSELCQCLRNGTIFCRRLPCTPNLTCKHKDVVYTHGTTFNHSERGDCRCIRGEMVCAKMQHMIKKPGLFLHVGYSLSDQYLIEGNSDVQFNPQHVSQKLAALLNGDSAKQFCTLHLYNEVGGNLQFEVHVSELSPHKDSPKHKCKSATQQLSYIINHRQNVIVTDVELSVLKVAQVQQISIYEPPPTESHSHWQPYESSRGRSVIPAIELVVALLFVAWGYTCCDTTEATWSRSFSQRSDSIHVATEICAYKNDVTDICEELSSLCNHRDNDLVGHCGMFHQKILDEHG